MSQIQRFLALSCRIGGVPTKDEVLLQGPGHYAVARQEPVEAKEKHAEPKLRTSNNATLVPAQEPEAEYAKLGCMVRTVFHPCQMKCFACPPPILACLCAFSS
jgi:hypothetical protein